MILSTLILKLFNILYCFGPSASFELDQHHSIEPIVVTEWASIKGVQQSVLGRDVDSFLGIRYAKPPIGELRFKRPVKPDKFENQVYEAVSFAPPCAQLTTPKYNFSIVTEDCLYLNIWRPSAANSIGGLKPVYFYIYGSGFREGSATEDNSLGDILASLGDMIVVTANHRLGFLGYGYGGSDQMPGNMGVYDILLALEWVKDNIRHFGGNPELITVAGNSAGSMQASTLVLSPTIPPRLFSKLHLMSGVSVPYSAAENKNFALKKSKLLVSAVGCASNGSMADNTEPLSAETMECLRSLNWTVILEAMNLSEITSLQIEDHISPFQQIWGTDLLPMSPDVLAERGNPSGRVHILIGNEEDEYLNWKGYTANNKSEAYEFLRNFTQRAGLEHMTEQDFDHIFSYYFEPIRNDQFDLEGAMISFIGDYFYYCPMLLFAEKWSQNGRIVHGYINEYVMDGYSFQDRPYGTKHGDDGYQIFGIAFRQYQQFSDRDRQITRKLLSYLGDFVRGEKVKWPPMLPRRNGRVLPLRWIISRKMDPRAIRVDRKDGICHHWGKVMGLKFSF